MTSRAFGNLVTYVAIAMQLVAWIIAARTDDVRAGAERCIWIIALQNAALWGAYYGRWYIRSERDR